jgi:hypothetical protein
MPEPTMSLQEFGRKIKSKYPQYEQLSDTAIAQKVIAKYPQYKALIRPAAPADATTLRAEAEKRRPKNEMKPAESGAGPWLANVERDLRGGGGRTAAGRILGPVARARRARLQRLWISGVSPGAAEFVGSAQSSARFMPPRALRKPRSIPCADRSKPRAAFLKLARFRLLS